MAELQKVKAGLQEGLDAGVMEWLTTCVLAALARDEPVGPAGLTFLLERYAATGRQDVGEALGRALAAAVENAPTVSATAERTAWTALFGHAARVSDDPRVRHAATSGVEQLSARWTTDLASGAADDVSTRTRAVEACLARHPCWSCRSCWPPLSASSSESSQPTTTQGREWALLKIRFDGFDAGDRLRRNRAECPTRCWLTS